MKEKPRYHVYPVDDSKEHDTVGNNCECDPLIVEHENGTFIVHNSFDGREAVEMAYEILNKKR